MTCCHLSVCGAGGSGDIADCVGACLRSCVGECSSFHDVTGGCSAAGHSAGVPQHPEGLLTLEGKVSSALLYLLARLEQLIRSRAHLSELSNGTSLWQRSAEASLAFTQAAFESNLIRQGHCCCTGLGAAVG